MFTKSIDNTHAIHKGTKPFQLLLFFTVLVCVLTIHPAKAHGQIIGDLQVSIPFQFYAGNAKLPVGKYVVPLLDNSDSKVMEISSADRSTAALFEVQDVEANSAPSKSELIFNKYGNRYFLTEIFDEGNPDGSRVPESQYEKRVGQAAEEAQAHVPGIPPRATRELAMRQRQGGLISRE
jgi:hypothetical protein